MIYGDLVNALHWVGEEMIRLSKNLGDDIPLSRNEKALIDAVKYTTIKQLMEEAIIFAIVGDELGLNHSIETVKNWMKY